MCTGEKLPKPVMPSQRPPTLLWRPISQPLIQSPAHPPIYAWACQSISLFIYPSMHLLRNLSTHPSVNGPNLPFTYRPIYSRTHPPIHPLIHLYTYPPIHYPVIHPSMKPLAYLPPTLPSIQSVRAIHDCHTAHQHYRCVLTTEQTPHSVQNHRFGLQEHLMCSKKWQC